MPRRKYRCNVATFALDRVLLVVVMGFAFFRVCVSCLTRRIDGFVEIKDPGHAKFEVTPWSLAAAFVVPDGFFRPSLDVYGWRVFRCRVCCVVAQTHVLRSSCHCRLLIILMMLCGKVDDARKCSCVR